MSQRLITDDRPSSTRGFPLKRLLLLAALVLIAAAFVRFRRRLTAGLKGLRPAEHRVDIVRDVAIVMPDGVKLYADHYQPRGTGPFPTILIRTPYGRASEYGWLRPLQDSLYILFAERGYHVLVQSVRGRFRSEGKFEACINEGSDGRATMEWIAAQPWFDGNLGMWGLSYFGYTQWAVAADAPPYLKAIVPIVTSTRFSRLFYPGGVFGLEGSLRWIYLLDAIVGPNGTFNFGALSQLLPQQIERVLTPIFAQRPMSQADRRVIGRIHDDYQRWLNSGNPDSPYWRSVDRHRELGRVDMAVLLIAGWYDIFLHGQLADYATLLAAQRTPYLSILPVAHKLPDLQAESVRQGLWWFDIHLRGQTEQIDSRRPVRLKLMGSHEWHEMDFWPPPAAINRYYLHAEGGLSDQAPAAHASQPTTTTYIYNPHDPTPSIGGPVLSDAGGPQDQRPLEARADLVCFTTAPLEEAVDVIGHVRLELFVRSSHAHTDFVGRLCVVEADGRSINVCEGNIRLTPEVGEWQADGSRKIEIDLWATAQRFRRGQRIRLHVCSAAHPRWSANLGTGEHPAAEVQGSPATQTIYHDSEHPSALVLPIVNHATRARMEQEAEDTG